jgi:hypothetical protein
MPTLTRAEAEVWMSGRETCRVLKLSSLRLATMAALGEVKFRAEPGRSIRYDRGDVERLAKEMNKSK